MKQQSSHKRNAPTCSSCNTPFDIYYHCPRILTKCGHTICQKCITNKVQTKGNKKILSCCQCSNQTIVRKPGSQQFPKNAKIIQVLKDIKKHNFSSTQKTPPISPRNIEKGCKEHNKPYQLKCLSCKQLLICSHCAIFGKHKNHVFKQIEEDEQQVSQNEIKQLQKKFNLLTGQIKQKLVPNSQNNLLRKSQSSLKDGLYKLIKLNFRQYYQPIQKKQQQMLKQCQQIKVQGDVQKAIDKILQGYQLVKLKFQNCMNITTHKSIEAVNEILNEIVSINKEISSVILHSEKKVEQVIHQIGQKMNNLIVFRIQQMSITLKSIYLHNKIETQKSDREGRRTTSPNLLLSNKKQAPTKKTSSMAHTFNNYHQLTKLQFKTPKENIGPLSNSGQRLQIQKLNLHDDFIEDQSQLISQYKYQIGSVKSQEQKRSKLINLAQKNTSGKNSRAQTDRFSAINQINSRTPIKDKIQLTNHNQLQKEKSKSSKPLQSRATTPRGTKKIQIPFDEDQKIQLKYVRPVKQISYELRPKLQQLCSQIDRQHQQGSGTHLQLVGSQINDTLLWYITQYLRCKKYKFSMIKLVKNNITDQGFKMFLSYLVKDNYTKVLNMTSNLISPKGILMLLKMAQENKILRTVYLSHNKISDFHIRSKKSQCEKFDLKISNK